MSYAADWFVRPAGEEYGKGDGAAFGHAWSGFDKIDWEKVKPGDTVYIGGTHVGTGLTIDASGEQGKRITIRGDASGQEELGVILGASKVFTNGWELHDAKLNVWKRPFEKTEVYSDFHAFARPKKAHPVRGITRLHNVGEPVDAGTGLKGAFARWDVGSYYRNEEAKTLYFKPDSGSANDYVYYAGYEPPVLSAISKHHLDIRNLTVMMGAGSKNRELVAIRGSDHVTVDNLTVRWGSMGIVFGPNWLDRLKPGAESENIVISNCTVFDCRCGIYPCGSVKDCRITDNHVHDIGQYGYYLPWKKGEWYGDIHGIAIQGGGNGLTIERNHVHHIGGEGIFAYSDNNPDGVNCKEMRNFHIRYNLVHDIKYLGSPAKPTHFSCGQEPALYYNQNNEFPSEAMGGNVMAYNVIYNARHGVRVKCNANKDTGKAPWEVYNNVFLNTDVGVCWYSSGGERNSNNKAGIVFKNNIVLNPKSRFVTIAPATIKEYDQLIFDNNIYHPALEQGFEWPGGKGDFTAWRIWTEGTERDKDSKMVNPLFVDEKTHDYHLKAGSPAIDAGAEVGLTKDHGGRPVPWGKAPDIGAFETEIAVKH